MPTFASGTSPFPWIDEPCKWDSLFQSDKSGMPSGSDIKVITFPTTKTLLRLSLDREMPGCSLLPIFMEK